MSILQAMYTGVTGIAAEGEALGVAGDNISNSNTVGFKEQRAVFEDMLGHSIWAGNGQSQPGSGVKMSAVQQSFTQGSLSTTGVSTDLALSGEGFFVMNGNVDGIAGNYYTRNGRLKIDSNGNLVNNSGLQAQGYAALPDGTTASSISSLKVPTSGIQPKSTLSVTIAANLNASAEVTYDPANPTTTSNFSTGVTVYDSLGAAHPLDIYFHKSDTNNSWGWSAFSNGESVGEGDFMFDANGALQSGGTATVSVPFEDGSTTPQSINLNFGTAIDDGGTGLDGVTQFSAESNITNRSQDGYASGDLSGVSIDSSGTVMGVYTNGQKLKIGQLAVAKFRSNEGLARAGKDQWVETAASGSAAIGTAGSGGRGSITSGSLEQSNVDLAKQFVDLITHQRAFQANSKTITTADEMLQELVNLKR